MARLFILLIVLFALISYIPSLEARKVTRAEKIDALLLEDSSSTQKLLLKEHRPVLRVLLPIEKDHAVETNVKLFTPDSAETERLFQSNPSPGIGN
ncbi:hypothetical protein TorRG33x02_057100 [Trema orientale]|uniref:Uncharacterized protein n=1 Tax=Trema orientale TaxID=63057 RepID=A0A2P5FL48_TREOI|nr:hypothetical protein TorRG33x02_057100 [Trema orientale]